MRRETGIAGNHESSTASSQGPSKWHKAGVDLCAEAAGDLAFCEALFVDMQRPVLELADWTIDQCAAYLKLQFAQRERDIRSRYPRADYCIVRFGGERVGRLVVDRSGTSIRLLEIVIGAGYRGRGIARDCLRRLCAEADARGCIVELLVAVENPAVRLYLDFDFEAVDNDGVYFKMRRLAVHSAVDRKEGIS